MAGRRADGARIVRGVLTLVDLFAGCGGMTRGFDDTAAFDSVFAVEFDATRRPPTRRTSATTMRRGPIEDVPRSPPPTS